MADRGGRAGNPARAPTPSAMRAFFAALRHAEASVHEPCMRIADECVFAFLELDSPNLFRAPRDGRRLVDPGPRRWKLWIVASSSTLIRYVPARTLVKGRLFAFFISIFIPFA